MLCTTFCTSYHPPQVICRTLGVGRLEVFILFCTIPVVRNVLLLPSEDLRLKSVVRLYYFLNDI